jgi:hypothetical protein
MSITTFNRIIVFNDLIYKELVGYKLFVEMFQTRLIYNLYFSSLFDLKVNYTAILAY